MGPKKSGGGKSAKLSKADKERLKQEEEARKAEEEEAARLKAEKEAEEREEAARREQEEKKRLEEQNSLRSQAELEELSSILNSNRDELLSLHAKSRSQQKWDRYMLCDGRPDPFSKKEVNTFINLLKENVDLHDVGQVLATAELILELIEELEDSLKAENIEEDQISEDAVVSYKESIAAFYESIFSKIDFSTFFTLKTPGEKIDPDSLNITHITSSKNIISCLWGNSAKNPRVKSVDFEHLSFSIELPKQLTLQNVAARVLLTKFDHFSPQSSTYCMKVKPVIVEEPALDINVEDATAEGEGDDTEENVDSGGEDALKPASGGSARTASSAKRIKSGKSDVSRIASAAKVDGDAEQTPDTNEEGAAEETVGTELAAPAAEEEELVDDDVVDLRNFIIVGPVMHVELLELPPQTKMIGSWNVQQVVPDELKRFGYAAAMAGLDGSSSNSNVNPDSSTSVPTNSSGTAAEATTSSATVAATVTPLSIKFSCPDDVFFFEPPLITMWNEEEKNWRLDEVDEFNFDEEKKLVSMKVKKFGQFALIQDMYLNMPFQSYEMYPVDIDHCFLSIHAAYLEVTVEIKGNQCCLCSPEDSPELKNIFKKWMSAEQFIKTMRPSGINVFPQEDGHKYVSVTNKDSALISSIYDQLALVSSAFSFTWSKWNNECSDEQVVFQACEWLQQDRPAEEDYKLYLASTRMSCQLQMEEFSENFSDEPAPNTERHADIYHTLLDGASSHAKARCSDSSVQYTDTVSKLLRECNFLVYS